MLVYYAINGNDFDEALITASMREYPESREYSPNDARWLWIAILDQTGTPPNDCDSMSDTDMSDAATSSHSASVHPRSKRSPPDHSNFEPSPKPTDDKPKPEHFTPDKVKSFLPSSHKGENNEKWNDFFAQSLCYHEFRITVEKQWELLRELEPDIDKLPPQSP